MRCFTPGAGSCLRALLARLPGPSCLKFLDQHHADVPRRRLPDPLGFLIVGIVVESEGGFLRRETNDGVHRPHCSFHEDPCGIRGQHFAAVPGQERQDKRRVLSKLVRVDDVVGSDVESGHQLSSVAHCRPQAENRSWQKLLWNWSTRWPGGERMERRAGRRPESSREGDGWSVADVVCTCGPCGSALRRTAQPRHDCDRVCRQLRVPVAGGRGLMTAGSLLLGNHGHGFECAHRHGEGDRCVSFWYAPDYFERLAADAGARRDRPALQGASSASVAPVVARRRARRRGHASRHGRAVGGIRRRVGRRRREARVRPVGASERLAAECRGQCGARGPNDRPSSGRAVDPRPPSRERRASARITSFARSSR